MDKIKEVIIDASNPQIIIINGKKYIQKKTTTKKIGKTIHNDKIIYTLMKEDDFEKDLNYLVKHLVNQTSSEEILKDLLKHTEPNILKSIIKKLKKGDKPIKHKGCLGFEIGGKYLEITP